MIKIRALCKTNWQRSIYYIICIEGQQTAHLYRFMELSDGCLQKRQQWYSFKTQLSVSFYSNAPIVRVFFHVLIIYISFWLAGYRVDTTPTITKYSLRQAHRDWGHSTNSNRVRTNQPNQVISHIPFFICLLLNNPLPIFLHIISR